MDAPAPIEIHLLGGFRVAVHGRAVPAGAWRQRRAAAIVKLLALASSHRLHREQLIETLWPELDGEAAANNLRVAIHRARRRLEAAGADPDRFLVRDGEDVFLAAVPVWVDVDAFEAAVARAWLTNTPAASREALDLYAGELLPEDLYEDWAANRRAELRASYLTLLARLAQLHEQRDELGRAIAALQRLLSAEPLDEPAHTALIRLFSRAGETRQAAMQYDRLVQLLDRELGTEPASATRELMSAINEGRFPEETQPFEPLAEPVQSNVDVGDPSSHERIGGLPAPLEDPIGRDREIAELRRLLGTRRLVTLTGPAGVGKTRLALAVAHIVAADRPGPVCFADLAPLRDPELVLPVIARALGVRDEGGLPILGAVIAHLRDTDRLLVLDNFEHLAPAAQTVADLLAACPGLKILITSRGRLRLRGEQECPVQPLAVPDPPSRAARAPSLVEPLAYPAVALFVRRARDAQPGVTLSATDTQAVAEICRRLDGLPLAIELAAARLRILTPVSLLARMERPLALLTGGLTDAPRRQQTLRAAIAWGHDLLDPPERALFARLAVFAGGFTLEAAEDVGSPITYHPSPTTLDLISSLVEQSLLRRLADTDGVPRFAMLETIREYAAERLEAVGETASIRLRHAAFFLTLAERAEPELTGAASAAWFGMLEREHDNLRAALTTLSGNEEPADALRLAGALWRFWWRHGHLGEGRARLERALAVRGSAPAAVQANALDGAGVLAAAQGDHDVAAELHTEALRLWREAGDRLGEVRTLTNLGVVADEQGDPRRAMELLQEALRLARASDDRRGLAVVLANLGQVAITLANHEQAALHFGESVALFRALGDQRDQAAILANLGVLAFMIGDFARAKLCHEEALTLLRALGDRQAEADELLNLGHTVQQQGDLERAAALFAEALDAFAQLGDRSGTAYALNHLGRLAHLRGNDEDAESLLAQGLALAQQIDDRVAIAEAWEGLAGVACARGEPMRGARLLGAAEALREVIGVPLPSVHLPGYQQCLADARRALGEHSFAAARAQGQAIALTSAASAPLGLVTGDLAQLAR